MQRQMIIVGAMAVTMSAAPVFASSYCPNTPPALSPLTDCYGNALKQNGKGQYVVTDVCGLQTIPSGSASYFLLGQNVDATCTANWPNHFSPVSGSFAGTLDGAGHWVNGLWIQSTESQVGLFQSTSTGSSVTHIALANVTIDGDQDGQAIGAITGQNWGNIGYVHVTGCVGGMLSCIENSQNTSTLIHLGAIAGENYGTISSTYSDAEVMSGLGNNNNGQFSYGGLAGWNAGSIASSFSSGLVFGDGGNAGGIAGYNRGSVNQSSSASSVGSNQAITGGIFGWNQGGSIEHSYATGNVSTSQADAGGAVDLLDEAGTVDQSYSVGWVVAPSGAEGGLIDRIGYGGGSATSSYWDTDVSGQSGSAAGSPLNTVQFQSALPNGFDSYWTDAQGYSYPFLTPSSCAWGGSSTQFCFAPAAASPWLPQDPNCTDPGPNPYINKKTGQNYAPPDPFFCSFVDPVAEQFQPVLAEFPLAPDSTQKQIKNQSGMYTALPMGQKQLFQYYNPANGETIVELGSKQTKYPAASLACLGTVYSMLARLVGAIYPTATVSDSSTSAICQESAHVEYAATAHIDCFLEDSTNLLIKGEAFWPSSLTKYAKIGAKTALNTTNLVETLHGGNVAVLHGNASGGGAGDHFMLATGVVTDLAGNPIQIAANDPETGYQVFIDLRPGQNQFTVEIYWGGTTGSQSYQSVAGFSVTADWYKPVVWKSPHGGAYTKISARY